MPPAISTGPHPWSDFLTRDWQGGRLHRAAMDARQPPAVSRVESATGWWEFVRGAPEPRLRGLVAGRVGYRERAQAAVQRRLPATSLIPVVLSFGERLEVVEIVDGRGAGRSYGSLVAGFQPGHAVTQFTGAQFALNLYLTPLGAYRILGVPGSTLAWGVHDLADRGREPDPLVEWVWHQLQASGGRVKVADLVAKSGWSHRHLISRFRDHVGVTPKTAANVIRFERASAALTLKQLSLAELAGRYGYADQSHLTREFVRFAGEPPAVYAASGRPSARGAIGQL